MISTVGPLLPVRLNPSCLRRPSRRRCRYRSDTSFFGLDGGGLRPIPQLMGLLGLTGLVSTHRAVSGPRLGGACGEAAAADSCGIVGRDRAGGASRQPDSGHAGTISITADMRRASWNAMKSQIQCVLTPWNP